MIDYRDIVAWGVTHPWPTMEQIEQDLLLTRAICEIANHELLGQELVFRGGTALNKLYADEATRYSEDLDYVRTTASGISPVTTALRDIGLEMGFKVASKIKTEAFRADLYRLTSNIPAGYDIDSAAELAKEILLAKV